MTFQFTEYPLANGTIVEASAGTGKTYSVAAHVTLAIASDKNPLRIGDILITTYTRNAAAELRDRVRGRMVATAELLRGRGRKKPDALDQHLLEGSDDKRMARARRLERAVAEFDTATIGTIHGVCMKVLSMAGIASSNHSNEEQGERILAEVVNDALLAEAGAGRSWEQKRMLKLVEAALSDPFIEPWFDKAGLSENDLELLGQVCQFVEQCVDRVQQAMQESPSFDELLRRAWQVVKDPVYATVLGELQRRYKLVIVDEAQDTSRLQWEFFEAIFPAGDQRPLVAVGDPKQAIYSFRGADVQSYLRIATKATKSDAARKARYRTLTINQRSDQPLLDVLNSLMKNATFGPEIAYQNVTASNDHQTRRIDGCEAVEIIDVGSSKQLVDIASRQVLHLLTTAKFVSPHSRPITERDICVLVRTNLIGMDIQRRLASMNIKAVTGGTASVMHGQTAEDIRLILKAMERPSDAGRGRRAAATAFFGHRLDEVGTLPEEEERIVQETIARLCGTLQKYGVAAWAAAIMAEDTMVACLTGGEKAERNVTDFNHVVELLHGAGDGKGCMPTQVLEAFAELHGRNDTNELVSRRVENDEGSVRIMTIHVAKGLQFPCVVVADQWKPENTLRGPAVYYHKGERCLDIAYALGAPDRSSPASREAVFAAINEERRRMLYVALTRAESHLCVLAATDVKDSVLMAVMPNLKQRPECVGPEKLLSLPDTFVRPKAAEATQRQLAPMPAAVDQTYRRTSFSGITAALAKEDTDEFAAEGRGTDEYRLGVTGDDEATADEAAESIAAVDAFAIDELPAGTAIGTAVHEIFDRIDLAAVVADHTLGAEVRRRVGEVATSSLLRPHHDAISGMLTAALETPFGGPEDSPFRNTCFAAIGPQDRVAEMNFEMSLAALGKGVLACHVGKVLLAMLPAGDPLAGYAKELAGDAFRIPLAGLINGSIDAVLRLPGSTPEAPQLVIADYKTNRLHAKGSRYPLRAYAPDRLMAPMTEHHYPLQSFIYGTAVYRMLRWRLKLAAPETCIAGVVYAFIRGMKGIDTPIDAIGRRYGVFTWQPPPALWPRLSRLFAGDLQGVDT